MELKYSRNRIYINESEQEIIKKIPILLGGGGIGSVIAECALRLGFENITIIDGDFVEQSNLNRQNYIEEDIGSSKVDSLYRRLKSINKDANIKYHHEFLTSDNLESYIRQHSVVINTLDFSSNVPWELDKKCQELNVPVLHPYNIGWGALVIIITKDTPLISSLVESGEECNEVTVVEYASGYLNFWGNEQRWIDDIIEKYKKENGLQSPPQLSVGSWLVASLCTHILFNIATNKTIKTFPEFYLSTLFNN